MNELKKRLVIVVTGTTASGKSALIYETLRNFPLVIINADSRQIYRDLKISAASPSTNEFTFFPHRLYNFLSIEARYSAGEYMKDVNREISDAHAAGKTPLICGGTFFYLKAMLEGLALEPEISETLRREVENFTVDEVARKLRELDPISFSRIHPHNVARQRRALLVSLAGNKPFSGYERVGGNQNLYRFENILVVKPREQLRLDIVKRTRLMFEQGLLGEIIDLSRNALDVNLQSLTGIGVSEFFEHSILSGRKITDFTQEDLFAIENQINQHTFLLAKRQQTWINSEKDRLQLKTIDPSFQKAHFTHLIQNQIES